MAAKPLDASIDWDQHVRTYLDAYTTRCKAELQSRGLVKEEKEAKGKEVKEREVKVKEQDRVPTRDELLADARKCPHDAKYVTDLRSAKDPEGIDDYVWHCGQCGLVSKLRTPTFFELPVHITPRRHAESPS